MTMKIQLTRPAQLYELSSSSWRKDPDQHFFVASSAPGISFGRLSESMTILVMTGLTQVS